MQIFTLLIKQKKIALYTQHPNVAIMQIMLNVHRNGVGICGVYPHEIAETKVETVEALARENGFPLKCIMERE